MPDFSTAAFQGARTDAQLATSIREGQGLMPAFGKQLNADGIAALVAIVRSFGPAAPQPDEAPPPAPAPVAPATPQQAPTSEGDTAPAP